MAVRANATVTLGLRGTTALTPEDVLDIVRTAADQVKDGGASLPAMSVSA